jgi:FixJ family two-component response regulator
VPSADHAIVVVDDDVGMTQAIERLLATAGWHVRSFTSAETALDSGAFLGAAVLILDLHLPGISGLELHRQLVAGGVMAPVIFMTARDRPKTRELVRRAGAAAYFTKPFSGDDLIAAVRQHLPAA